MSTNTAPNGLGVNVFTAPGKAVVGERPKPFGPPLGWDPITSTLIYGQYDAVLVDALTTVSEANALAEWVSLHRCNLTTIYVTHGHFDHFFGLSVLLDRFPDAKAIATPKSVELILLARERSPPFHTHPPDGGTCMNKREGKVAVITGGDSGIGLATARRFVAEGASVYLTGRRQHALDAAVSEIGQQATGIQGDVSQLADLDRLYTQVRQRHARIDVLFANAGVREHAALGDITEAHFDTAFNINVKGTVFTVQKALPLLPDGASIILNASIVASKGGKRSVSTARPRPPSARSPGPGPSICKPARFASTPSALAPSTPQANGA